MDIKGDITVSRTGLFGRRIDQGLNRETIGGVRVVDKNDYQWLALNSGVSDQDVDLPDATTLPQGWSQVIQNTGASNVLTVKDGAGGTLLVIAFATEPAYLFTLLDNSAAAGVWYIQDLSDTNAGVVASKYVATFLNTDFPSPSGGYRILTSGQIAGLAAATHGRGPNPSVQVQSGTGPFDKVLVDDEQVSATGDISLQVTDGAEFTGRVVLV